MIHYQVRSCTEILFESLWLSASFNYTLVFYFASYIPSFCFNIINSLVKFISLLDCRTKDAGLILAVDQDRDQILRKQNYSLK